MIINCRCGTRLEVDEDMFGEEIQCPKCRTTMVAPAAPAPAQPSKRSEFTATPPQPGRLSFPPQPGPTSAPQAAPGTTSANAIACLNMGINSFIVPFVLAIPSILFGFLALRDCRKYRMQGKSMALMGMTLSVFSSLCLGIIFYMVFPTLKQAYQLVKGMGKGGDLAKMAGGDGNFFGQLAGDPKARADSIAKALQSYQKEKGGAFPSPNLGKRSDGLSWRVGILPYLNDPMFPAEDLQRIAWDQPENHQANAFLGTKMPLAFMMGAIDDVRPAPPGMTTFELFTGPETLFPDRNKGVRLADVPAGRRSSTILFAESSTPVTWQAPADMELKPGQPLPLPRGKFAAGFVDGSVRLIDRSKVNDQTLRKLIDPRSGPVSLPAD